MTLFVTKWRASFGICVVALAAGLPGVVHMRSQDSLLSRGPTVSKANSEQDSFLTWAKASMAPLSKVAPGPLWEDDTVRLPRGHSETVANSAAELVSPSNEERWKRCLASECKYPRCGQCSFGWPR